MYLWSLGGTVERPMYMAGTRFVHVTEEYDRVMKFLNQVDEWDDEQNKRYADYRERVIGNNPVIFAPQEYNILSIIKELGISILEWETYPLHHRAKLTAHHYLKIMGEVIDNHYREQRKERDANNKRG